MTTPLLFSSQEDAVVTRALRPAPALRWLLLALSLVALLFAAPAWAQSTDDIVRMGNRAYNKKDYRGAVSIYAKAIQSDPRGALKAYLNTARAYNQLKEFHHSTQYYEWYMELETEKSKNHKVKAEYKHAKRKRRKQPAVPVINATQTNALQRLDEALKSNAPIMTRDGGGVYGLYSVLLRTGYAAPMLANLRAELGRRLFEEAQSVVIPPANSPVPSLQREGWRLVIQRLDHAKALGVLSVGQEDLESALKSTALGWEALIRADHPTALAHFEAAIAVRQDIPASRWGHALATLYTDSGDYALTFEAIGAAEATFKTLNLPTVPFFDLLRANTLQLAGRGNEAVVLIRRVKLPAP